MTNQQSKPIVVGTPVEIGEFIENLRKDLAKRLPWLTHPFFVAERFVKKIGNRNYYFPETYSPQVDGKFGYHRLTPDNDYSGMCFFVVGKGKTDFEPNEYNFINYKVGLIFSVNLKLIDQQKLNNGLFTRELMRDARRIITENGFGSNGKIEQLEETNDLRECFKEFVLDDLEAYNRAPMQCFRFDMDIKIQELC